MLPSNKKNAKMKQTYLIRLDDACSTMDRAKWGRIEKILDSYGIKPMVGLIPNNEDPKQQIDSIDTGFWNKVSLWEKKNWAIALHGYNHCYSSEDGLNGLNPMWRRSEFAGLPLDEQRGKIRKGVAIMREHGINPKYFFAPSHTFDENTLNALRDESDIRIISDTIATKPYRFKDFVIVPQLGGHCVEVKLHGTWTFCLHPNMMSDENFFETEKFIKTHKNQFVSFDQLDISSVKQKDWFSKLLSWAYFTQRKIRGIQ